MKKGIELKEGAIRHLQEYMDYKLKEWKFDDETLHERLLLLAEEVGELIHACRQISGMNIDQKRGVENEVGEEIADVFNLLFAVAIKAGIDIENEFLRKEKRVNERVYKRST